LGSVALKKVTSLPSWSNARSVAKISISTVLDETKSFATTGPAISISWSSGPVANATPSLCAR
jgi:hypothetical protein